MVKIYADITEDLNKALTSYQKDKDVKNKSQVVADLVEYALKNIKK